MPKAIAREGTQLYSEQPSNGVPLRLVLDTNVWLDWLVFDDPCIAPIKAAIAAGRAAISTDAACEQELTYVLARPLSKTMPDAGACLAECRRFSQKSEGAELTDAANPLPTCRDPDDQKFLVLALACRADYLITKDRALLELARHKVRRAPFGIVTPRQFAVAMGARD